MVRLAVHLFSVGTVKGFLCYFLFFRSSAEKRVALHALCILVESLTYTDDPTADSSVESVARL